MIGTDGSYGFSDVSDAAEYAPSNGGGGGGGTAEREEEEEEEALLLAALSSVSASVSDSSSCNSMKNAVPGGMIALRPILVSYRK